MKKTKTLYAVVRLSVPAAYSAVDARREIKDRINHDAFTASLSDPDPFKALSVVALPKAREERL